jgi:spore coat polysaccharide biosynthesis protein SpsF
MAAIALVELRPDPPNFAGRAMADIGGKPALQRSLIRADAIAGVAGLVVVAPDDQEAEAATRFAKSLGVRVVRGPAEDALGRLAKAARLAGADTIVRLTAAQPLFDPRIAGRLLAFWRTTGAAFGGLDMPNLWPQGLEAETFSAGLLARADKMATHAYERAHPTAWMRAQPDVTKACLLGPGCGFEMLRWRLETPRDLEFHRAVYAALGREAERADAATIAALLLRRRDLIALNEETLEASRQRAQTTANVLSVPETLLAA